MNCRKAQIQIIPYILGDLEPKRGQRERLEAHLLGCQACANKYETRSHIVRFVGRHKVIVGESLKWQDGQVHTVRKARACFWNAVPARLTNSEALKAKERWARCARISVMLSAAAACLVIGISIWLVSSGTDGPGAPSTPLARAYDPPGITIELQSNNDLVTVSAGEKVIMATNDLKTVVINGEHQVVMNSETALSVEQLLLGEAQGCLVNLHSGEVLVHVAPEGQPFVVRTLNARVVATGTSFDVKVTNTETTVVVSEGSVRFESQGGLTLVEAGQISKIAGRAAPTVPRLCNDAKLTAWAIGHEIEAALTEAWPASDNDGFSDLCATAAAGPVELERIRYHSWVENNQEWFRRGFPWIFQLKDALAKEGIGADYPELIVSSGDIWQFVYPQVSVGRIALLDSGLLVKAASGYGFDEQWLLRNVASIRLARSNSGLGPCTFTGLEAFEKWAGRFKEAQNRPGRLAPETLLYSLRASTFLVNTRTLIWLSINRGEQLFRMEDEAEALARLQSQVRTANDLTKEIIRVLSVFPKQSCDKKDSKTICQNIGTIADLEERIQELKTKKRKGGSAHE